MSSFIPLFFGSKTSVRYWMSAPGLFPSRFSAGTLWLYLFWSKFDSQSCMSRWTWMLSATNFSFFSFKILGTCSADRTDKLAFNVLSCSVVVLQYLPISVDDMTWKHRKSSFWVMSNIPSLSSMAVCLYLQKHNRCGTCPAALGPSGHLVRTSLISLEFLLQHSITCTKSLLFSLPLIYSRAMEILRKSCGFSSSIKIESSLRESHVWLLWGA